MSFERKSKAIHILTGVLTLCMIFGAFILGVYPVSAASINSVQVEQYYEADSLPLFGIEFSRLDEKEQLAWLEKIYVDGEIAFFSILTDYMDEIELKSWLDRALEDGRINFQSMLFDKLEMDDEKDAWEKEWEEQLISEYQAVGVTNNRKNYYYQRQLVNIFLDIRPNQSFYTLNMNPAGTVNIKIIRGEDGKITGVSYMEEAEVTELLGSMNDPDDF